MRARRVLGRACLVPDGSKNVLEKWIVSCDTSSAYSALWGGCRRAERVAWRGVVWRGAEIEADLDSTGPGQISWRALQSALATCSNLLPCSDMYLIFIIPNVRGNFLDHKS